MTPQKPVRSGLGALVALVVLGVLVTSSLAGTGTRRYQYDALGRLVRAEMPNGRVVEYTYDAAGNILSTRSAFPDGDGDGVPDASDCAPGDAAVYPGAPEINDGQDNQCAGGPGYGLADEILGPLVFADATTLAWPAQPGATMYQVARSSVPSFGSSCRMSYSPVATLDVEPAPAPGAAHHFLVRAYLPHAGSWGANSSGAERTAVCP